jgi:Glycosyltransferase family 25 (LPS biosynthesis protein)
VAVHGEFAYYRYLETGRYAVIAATSNASPLQIDSGQCGVAGPRSSAAESVRQEVLKRIEQARLACAGCEHCEALRTRMVRCRLSDPPELSLLRGWCPVGEWPNARKKTMPSAHEGVVSSPCEDSRRDFFDRVVCINLDRRPERWARFQDNQKASGWPFRPVERFRAVDGKRVPPPRWWRAGASAWGCLQSHARILEQALQDGVESLLILEDDAVLPDDFVSRVGKFLELVPEDWDAIMLGGQHLEPPQSHLGVFRVRNGNRTHAHAMRGRYISAAYRHLCNSVEHANRPHKHVDHRLGELHRSGRFNVYAPLEWIVGQAAGPSDIAGKEFPVRFWTRKDIQAEGTISKCPPPPPLVVLGTYRSGSSCLAGVLHHLGGHGGRGCWKKRTPWNPRGLFEPPWLSRQLRMLCDEPRLRSNPNSEEMVRLLRDWSRREWHRAKAAGRFLFVKHPLLCLLGSEFETAWERPPKILSIERPPERSVESLRRVGWWSAELSASVIERLASAREQILVRHEHMRVEFSQLVLHPERVILEICRFVGIGPTPAQLRSAIQFVDSELVHVGGAS